MKRRRKQHTTTTTLMSCPPKAPATRTTISKLTMELPLLATILIIAITGHSLAANAAFNAPPPPPSSVSPPTQQQQQHTQSGPESSLVFDPETNAYSGLTFTFDPRLDKRVEWLHFEHWLSIMQQSSAILYEALNGRAHLAEIRVLIPYKWRHVEWPVLHKPGSPIMMNRHLRFTDSDVIVGFEDPIYKETPFAIQHDECGQKGLNIRMPISFLEQSSSSTTPIDSRLRARQFVREFASHRYGIFKESGFRSDFMYPPFASLAGLDLQAADAANGRQPAGRWSSLETPSRSPQSALNRTAAAQLNSTVATTEWQLPASNQQQQQLRGFDENWQECSFDTSPTNGLPANAQAANCLPYLTKTTTTSSPPPPNNINSFNLMSSDPFSYIELQQPQQQQQLRSNKTNRPLEWRDLAGDQVRWHFCGDNFQSNSNQLLTLVDQQQQQHANVNQQQQQQAIWFEHNQRATNKQNKMCQERSALEVIKSSDDFRRAQFSPSTFNRLPAPNFKFLQEMPPRVIMCFEYTSHLYQSRRLDHNFIEATINKFLAFDLIAESEVATVIFGQHFAKTEQFQKLDSSLSTRFTIFNPAVDPFDESVLLYGPNELNSQQQNSGAAKIIKGTCSLAKLMNEVNSLLQKANQYDDIGADLIIITSGLFVEDEPKIEDILRGSNFKLENNRLHLIIYPSTLLFDTKSRDGFVVLDSVDSETIIKQRINKLLLIQRLTNGQIHLVKEHLDSNGDIKAATITQFYQIFDHISKGHSWDQTQSMTIIDHKPIEARPLPYNSHHHQLSSTATTNGSTKLTYQFELDSSVQNELFVGLLEPKPSPNSLGVRSGKRFSLKSLQLRSPGGQMIFTETSTLHHPIIQHSHHHHNNNSQTAIVAAAAAESSSSSADSSSESAFFAYRAQMSLAAFHVKPWHLSQLNSTGRLSGTWTLSAISEEPIQTSGIAMARVNPGGDTLTANCWIQTQHSQQADSSDQQAALKSIKVFVQTKSGVQQLAPQDLQARMEVQDQFGNIVQNVHMLDDGLGSPDMTKGDGIWSQSVQRTYRLGFYKVSVELSSQATNAKSSNHHHHQQELGTTNSNSALKSTNGQDNICCGSSIPAAAAVPKPDTRHLTRQLYCGTFYVDPQNELAEQRPPRVNNLTVVNVDQDNRRVTIRWFEPLVDIAVSHEQQQRQSSLKQQQQLSDSLAGNDLWADESAAADSATATGAARERTRRKSPPAARHVISGGGSGAEHEGGVDEDVVAVGQQQQQDDADLAFDQAAARQTQQRQQSGSKQPSAMNTKQQQQQDQLYSALNNRYEIKMFTDRDMVKRAFDAKHEVGFKFNEWNVEGLFPNATNYGGMKEVTLRIPSGREGIYFLAMKVYNNIGLGSQLSNIVQFYIRNQLSLEEAESIYGQAATMDADGNLYDKNGDLIQRGGSGGANQLNYSLLRGGANGAAGAYSLDSLSVLILFSLLAFIMSIVCITLVACLANSARKSLAKQRKSSAHGKASDSSLVEKQQQQHANSQGSVLTNIGTSGSSSLASTSGCGSSQHSGSSDTTSSVAGGNQAGSELIMDHHHQQAHHQHELDLNKLHLSALGDELTYSVLQQQQRDQQHQAQLIQSQHMMMSNHQHHQRQQSNYYQPPQHTIVNGYTYATVNGSTAAHMLTSQQHGISAGGDLNENGLVDQEGDQNGNYQQVQSSWPAEILLSHYDKVKQARERNEAPPVMRFETIEQNQVGQSMAEGLPSPLDESQQQQQQQQITASARNNLNLDTSYLVRDKSTAAANSYFNQQLQQQLSHVLKSKRPAAGATLDEHKSPALEGVTGDFDLDHHQQQQAAFQQQQHQSLGPLPPAHYIYCSPSSQSGVGGGDDAMCGLANHVTDPTIYSQTTNLSPMMDNYYANATTRQQQWTATEAIYSEQHHNQFSNQQQYSIAATATVGNSDDADNYDKSNSAISEV